MLGQTNKMKDSKPCYIATTQQQCKQTQEQSAHHATLPPYNRENKDKITHCATLPPQKGKQALTGKEGTSGHSRKRNTVPPPQSNFFLSRIRIHGTAGHRGKRDKRCHLHQNKRAIEYCPEHQAHLVTAEREQDGVPSISIKTKGRTRIATWHT